MGLSGRALRLNELAVGLVLIVAAASAQVHLRGDVRYGRPLAM